jgi:hypothetical protein
MIQTNPYLVEPILSGSSSRNALLKGCRPAKSCLDHLFESNLIFHDKPVLNLYNRRSG